MAADLVGKDALATERHWQHLYNRFRDQGQKGLVVTALSGIDLKGRHFEAPIHVLMGGPLRSGSGPMRPAPIASTRATRGPRLRRGRGFSAVKLKIGIDEDERLIRAVREGIGPSIGLMLDANHGFDAIEAVELGRRVAPLNIGWFEEPVVPDDLDSYVEVRRGQPIPVAGGECEFTRWGFREVLARRAIDILQPDTCAAGDLSGCKKIADMATAFGVRYVPHVWGCGIGLAAALQLLAVLSHSPPRHTPLEPMLSSTARSIHFRQAAVLMEPLEHAY